MPLPWIPAAIRQTLLDDTAFSVLVGGRVSTDLPADVTEPCCTVQLPGNLPIGGMAVAWSPLVQVDAWCPPRLEGEEAASIVWRIATDAARVLGTGRARLYEAMRYTVRLTDGPLPGIDKSRGEANPLYHCLIRAELRAGAL